jgi:hypothetical protein
MLGVMKKQCGNALGLVEQFYSEMAQPFDQASGRNGDQPERT